MKCLIVILMLAGCAAPTNSQKNEIIEQEKVLLKNYAFNYCMYFSYADQNIAEDAKYFAGAYLERGKVGIDAYEKLRALSEEYSKKNI